MIPSKRGIVLIALMVLGFLAFAFALKNPFQFDDILAIALNRWLHWSYIPSFFRSFIHDSNWTFVGYRPWLMASFVANHELFGSSPLGFRMTNLLLHIFNAFLVYRLAIRILGPRNLNAAFVAALLFLLHPVQGNVIFLVWKRSDLWLTFGILGSILFGWRWLEGRGGSNLLASLLFAIIGMTSKESAILLPFAWLLINYFFIRPKSEAPKFQSSALTFSFTLFSLGLIYLSFIVQPDVLAKAGVLSETSVPPSLQLDRSTYFATQSANLIEYLGLILLPLSLSVYHNILPVRSVIDPRFLFGLFLVASLLVAAWYACRSKPILSFAILWFFLFLLPSSSLVPLNLPFDEDRLYLPMFGVALAAGALFTSFSKSCERSKHFSPQFLYLLVGLLSLLAISKEWSMSEEWSSPLRLWSANVVNEPEDSRAWTQLGRALADLKQHGRAIEAFSRASEIEPSFALPILERGTERLLLHDYEGAAVDLEKAFRIDSFLWKSLGAMGTLESAQGNEDRAARRFLLSISLHSKWMPSFRNLASLLEQAGENDGALAVLRSAIAVNPHDIKTQARLAKHFWFVRKDRENALFFVRSGLTEEPKDPTLLYLQKTIEAGLQGS